MYNCAGCALHKGLQSCGSIISLREGGSTHFDQGVPSPKTVYALMPALALMLREKLNLEDFLFQAKGVVIQNTVSGVQLPGSKSRLCHFPGVWP